METPSNPRIKTLDGPFKYESEGEDYFSLRDHFAGLAMQSLMTGDCYDLFDTVEKIAKESYIMADEMLKQRML